MLQLQRDSGQSLEWDVLPSSEGKLPLFGAGCGFAVCGGTENESKPSPAQDPALQPGLFPPSLGGGTTCFSLKSSYPLCWLDCKVF